MAAASPFWQLVTRLGEAQIVLPAALLTALAWLRRAEGRSLALAWLGWLLLAVLVTTASKVAFIGWGIGSAAIDFTGVSGHAMFAAAIYPLLAASWAAGAGPAGRRVAIAGGAALALLVGVSRVVVGAHSGSEVLAGLLVGGLASAATLNRAAPTRAFVNPLLPVVVVLWLALMPTQASASRTHSAVTRLSLALSGHRVPYTRRDLLRRLERPTSTAYFGGMRSTWPG